VRNKALRWGGALALGILAAVAVVRVGTPDEGAEKPLFVPGVGMAAYLEPVSHPFADPVLASVEVVLRPRRVDPDSIQLAARFTPYRAESTRREVRTERGVMAIRWTYRLTCLTADCRPRPGNARIFQFPPVQVSYRRRDGRPGVRRVEWHALRSVSRLDAEGAARENFQARQHPLPEISWRVGPGKLAAGLLGAAALVALVGAALLWVVLSPLLIDRIGVRRFARLDAVQRQLVVLRDAVERSDTAAQRKALDALSMSLGRNGDATEELAHGARRLAWSPRDRSPSDVLGFADRVAAQVQSVRKARR
jgi:hypothetical protein